MSAKPASRKRLECCRAWDEMDRAKRGRWAWQALHQLAHSRTTFSVGTLADLARIGDGEAGEMVQEAERLKWVWTPQVGVWVGQLPTRR